MNSTATGIIIGNACRDATINYGPSGMAVTRFSVAVNRREKGADGNWGNTAQFFDVTLFGKQAEFAADDVKKGTPVYVLGDLSIEDWTDRGGQKRTSVKIIARTIITLRGGGGRGGDDSYARPKRNEQTEQREPDEPKQPDPSEGPIPDDCPF